MTLRIADPPALGLLRAPVHHAREERARGEHDRVARERGAVAEEHGWELYNALRFREAVSLLPGEPEPLFAAAAVVLVSTMASLQNSIPVHAMVPRRNREGAALRPSPSSSAVSSATCSSAMSSSTSFWCGVVRSR